MLHHQVGYGSGIAITRRIGDTNVSLLDSVAAITEIGLGLLANGIDKDVFARPLQLVDPHLSHPNNARCISTGKTSIRAHNEHPNSLRLASFQQLVPTAGATSPDILNDLDQLRGIGL